MDPAAPSPSGPPPAPTTSQRLLYDDLREKIRIAPDVAEFWLRLGNLCEQLGKRDEAVGALLRVMRLKPHDMGVAERLRRLATPLELSGVTLPTPARSPWETPERLLRYPLRGVLPVILIAYPILGSCAATIFLFAAPFFPPLYLLGAIVLGLLPAFLQRVIRSSLDGEDDPPGWPEPERWEDEFVLPYLHTFILSLEIGVAPAARHGLLSDTSPLGWVLDAACWIYAPWAVFAGTYQPIFARALSPVFVVRSALRLGRDGRIFTGIWCLQGAAVLGLSRVCLSALETDGIQALGALGFVFVGALGTYLLLLDARILGLLANVHREPLGLE